jgi:cardiolipin synthase A/B
MGSLWDAVERLCDEAHPDTVRAFASRVASLATASDFAKACDGMGSGAVTRDLADLGEAWREHADTTPRELAAAIRAVVHATEVRRDRESVELVWTGPPTPSVPVRHTAQVLGGVIEGATDAVFVVSYAAYTLPGVVQRLNDAVRRGVRVSVLLEPGKEHGGHVDHDGVTAMRSAVTGAYAYVWDPDANESGASMHAKCVVADGNTAFVTSANLTDAAMERNMELGVLVKGGTVPDRLHRHLDALVTTRVVKRIGGP